jgi:YidC/Oxa1 family membrane protein insertase
MAYPESSFAGFDTVLAVGDHHMIEFPLLKGVEHTALSLPVGYGRMDVMKAEYDSIVGNRQSSDRPSVIMAPSWHEDNTLETIGVALTELLLANNFTVVFRPHYKIVENNPNLIKKMLDIYGENSFFTMEVAGQGNSNLYKADVMIGDYSGVAIEYAFLTERPVLFVDAPLKQRNPNWAEIGLEPIELKLRNRIGKVVPVDCELILEGVYSLLEEKDQYQAVIKEERMKYCYNFESSAGKVAADRLLDLLNRSAKEAIR